MELTATDSLVQIAPFGAAATVLQTVLLEPSRFNSRRSAPDGSLLLYNSYSGAFSAFPPHVVQDVLVRLARTGYSGQLVSLTKYMFDRGYLVPAQTDELARARMLYAQQQNKPDTLELILLASEECNFRCVYCYEEFPRETMEPWVAEGIIRMLQARIKRLNRVKVEWFGGEPLLGWPAIERIAPAVQAICRENDVQYSSGMTTNGYLLTPERFAKLVSWGVTGYQITLDGPKEHHDAHRPLKEGGSSFNSILSNLLAMHETTFEFGVAVRVNFDRASIEGIPTLLTLLNDLKGDSRFRLRFYPVGRWGGKNDAELEVCGTSAEEELQNLNTLASSNGHSPESRLTLLQPSGNNVCYAARPYNLIIGADGKIMKCTVALDTKDYNIVGMLKPDGQAEIDLDKFAKWVNPYFEDDVACKRCFHLPVCQGSSCPLPRIETGARPCPPAKQQIGKTLQSIWRAERATGRPHKVI